MEAIIRTENKTLFEAILVFLQKLNFTVETRKEKITQRNNAQPEKQNKFLIPVYKCAGKVSDFNREDLYASRL